MKITIHEIRNTLNGIQVTSIALGKIRELEDASGAYPKSNLEGK